VFLLFFQMEDLLEQTAQRAAKATIEQLSNTGSPLCTPSGSGVASLVNENYKGLNFSGPMSDVKITASVGRGSRRQHSHQVQVHQQDVPTASATTTGISTPGNVSSSFNQQQTFNTNDSVRHRSGLLDHHARAVSDRLVQEDELSSIYDSSSSDDDNIRSADAVKKKKKAKKTVDKNLPACLKKPDLSFSF
jgi:hypothetical protein